jgi:hypothetical protein
MPWYHAAVLLVLNSSAWEGRFLGVVGVFIKGGSCGSGQVGPWRWVWQWVWRLRVPAEGLK